MALPPLAPKAVLAAQLVAAVTITVLAGSFSQQQPLPEEDVVLEFELGSDWETYSYPAVCAAAGKHISPDSMPIAWHHRPTNTSYFMVADHRHMYAGTGPSLDQLSACSTRIFTSANDSTPQSYANFQWLQSVRVFGDGTAVGLVHNEFKGEFPADTGPQYCSRHCADSSPVNASGCRDQICEIWSTGLVRSSNGAQFQLVAPPPHHLVAALPHRYQKDENLTGFGAISNGLQRGEDGAYYGSINVVNRCTPGSTLCGDTPAGNCLFRAVDLTDPASFRAIDQNGNFTVKWASAYSPRGEGEEHKCATLPVTAQGRLGSHVSFRKIVSRGQSVDDGEPPTYIALSDASPAVGHVKYSLTYQPDFGVAMRNINTSWTPPKFLDLSSAWRGLGGSTSVEGDGMKYFYPTLLDVRSPELGVLGGSVHTQEDGDSYALVSFPRRLPRECTTQADHLLDLAIAVTCGGWKCISDRLGVCSWCSTDPRAYRGRACGRRRMRRVQRAVQEGCCAPRLRIRVTFVQARWSAFNLHERWRMASRSTGCEGFL
jgi:hypothetical protein